MKQLEDFKQAFRQIEAHEQQVPQGDFSAEFKLIGREIDLAIDDIKFAVSTRTFVYYECFTKRLSLGKVHILTLSPQIQRRHSSNLPEEKCIGEVVRISSIIIFHLSKLWKARFFILCDVIFLVRLQGKFEIDNSWE